MLLFMMHSPDPPDLDLTLLMKDSPSLFSFNGEPENLANTKTKKPLKSAHFSGLSLSIVSGKGTLEGVAANSSKSIKFN